MIEELDDSLNDSIESQYSSLFLFNDPLDSILEEGNFNKFKLWFDSYIPTTEKEIRELEKYVDNVLIPKIVCQEYFEWVGWIESKF